MDYPDITGKLNVFVDTLATKMHREIVALTPIDTGAARLNWSKRKISDTEYLLINPLPYIARLDDGWSSQAPTGMVTPLFKASVSIANKLFKDTI